MSFYSHAQTLPKRFRLILLSFLQRPGLPFADALPEEAIQKAFEDQGATFADEPDAVYTPAVTLWAFLSQVLFQEAHRSCVAAVVRVSVLLVSLERGPCSTNTGAYCRARGKLSEQVIRRITLTVAESCEDRLDPQWLWHGRHVRLVDGTTVSMPDTPENQSVYPQNPQQKAGLGFPIARMVVVLSLASGMLTDMALGPYAGKETGEAALLRSMLDRFKPGDVLLADRFYCSYLMIALLQEVGIDFVARVHSRRPICFRRGRRLGSDDQVVTWHRPKRPAWMDQQTYERMPATLQVRQVRVHVRQPGFRTASLVAVTTLTDSRTYTRDDIAQLYHHRWLAELDIRSIKITMGMDVLRCKTPEMVRKEAWTCLLAYNLIRQTMLQSARRAGVLPRTLSFTAAVQSIAANWLLAALSDEPQGARLLDALLAAIAEHPVGHRPGRVEPRAIKRRPKEHALLTQPRAQARAELLKLKGKESQ